MAGTTWDDKKKPNIDAVIGAVQSADGREHPELMPDIYGRAIRFQSALKEAQNNSGNLSKAVLQWRGILTLLALKDYLELDIVIEKVDLESGIPRDNFFATALHLFPRDSLFKLIQPMEEWEWKWAPFYVIKIKSEGRERSRYEEEGYIDIALFSPTTLVFPVTEIEKKMPYSDKISWFQNTGEGKCFLDPVVCLKPEHKHAVAFWLGQMENQLNAMNGSTEWTVDASMRGVLLNLLSNYKNELNIRSENMKWFSMTNISNDRIWSNSAAGIPQIGAFINRTVKTSLSIDGINKNIDIHDIFARELCYMKHVESEDSDKAEVRIYPFENCQYADKHRMTNDSNEDYYAFIPFGEKFVELLSENPKVIPQIMNVFSIRINTDMDEVTANLALSRISPGGMDITCEYPFGNGNLFQGISLALWPGKYHEKWLRYFIYYNDNATGMELCVPPNIGGKSKTRGGCEIFQFDNYPEAIGVKNQNKVYAGAMFLRKERGNNLTDGEADGAANNTATVCVDFGTSGTIAYVDITDENGRPEQEISMADEGALPLLLRNDERKIREISENFIPVIIKKEKLYSIYKKYSMSVRTTPEPLLDGIIYLAENMEIIKSNEQEQYLTNIKWMTNADRGWFIAFLQQFCMQISWKLLQMSYGNIKWKYAVPLSLNEQSRNNIDSAWKKEIKSYLMSVTGMAHDMPDIHTESEAVSSYFARHPNVTANEILQEEIGYAVADIGGGSTDFSLWKKEDGQIMWETSVNMAGRKIFSTRAFRYIEKLRNVLDPEQDAEIRKLLVSIKSLGERSGDEVAIAFFERFIGEHGEKLRAEVARKCGDSNMEWIEEFRAQIALGAAMILFCMGQMAGEAIEAREFRPADGGVFYITLAGNGANLFDWIYNDSWNEVDAQEKYIFNHIFGDGVYSRIVSAENDYNKFRKMDVRIVKSPNPKKEVAMGLLQVGKINFKPKGVKTGYEDKDIIKWKDVFFESVKKHFTGSTYLSYLLDNGIWNEKLQKDNRWENVANNDPETGCCGTMMNILEKLYNWLEKSWGYRS